MASRSGFIPSISSSLNSRSARAQFDGPTTPSISQDVVAARLWQVACIKAFKKTRPVKPKLLKTTEQGNSTLAQGTAEDCDLFEEGAAAIGLYVSEQDNEQDLQNSEPGEHDLWEVESLGSVKMLSSETNTRVEEALWFEWS